MKTIVLDRDGVINIDSDAYIKAPHEWVPIPGSIEAIARLHTAGFSVVIATNQSGIARNYFTEQTLADIHKKMLDMVHEHGGLISKIAYCPHGPLDNCDCRKPKPGLLERLIPNISMRAHTPMVGDTIHDFHAAKAAGMPFYLVKTGKGEKTLTEHHFSPDGIFNNLSEFVDFWLQRQ